MPLRQHHSAACRAHRVIAADQNRGGISALYTIETSGPATQGVFAPPK